MLGTHAHTFLLIVVVCQILNFVRVAVNARKVNLQAVDRSFNVSDDDDDELVFELPVDVQLHEFTVSVSGQRPHITVTDPTGLHAISVSVSVSVRKHKTDKKTVYEQYKPRVLIVRKAKTAPTV